MKSGRYIKSHNLVNRCYDMLCYFDTMDETDLSVKEIKNKIFSSLHKIETVETYAKYFDSKLKQYKKNIELRCNLCDLISDLNFLKQIL